MKSIIGLGNPGKKYERTRHNVGFLILDYIAQAFDFPSFKSESGGLVSKGSLFGVRTILCKPQTFMNLSGHCVTKLLGYYKIDIGDCVIIHDDIDMEFGKLRVRKTGGAGGHNGIKSIIEQTGTKDFNRIKIGISRPEGGGSVSDYVLNNFAKEDLTYLKESVFPEIDENLKTLL